MGEILNPAHSDSSNSIDTVQTLQDDRGDMHVAQRQLGPSIPGFLQAGCGGSSCLVWGFDQPQGSASPAWPPIPWEGPLC